jgi:HlyD family secretion protein
MNMHLPSGAFQPIDTAARMRGRTRKAFGLVGLLLLALFVLGLLLNVAGAVVGAGEVTVETSVKTISHAEGGILADLKVRDGDHVDEGQELMRFDSSVSSVGSESATRGVEQLQASRARLEAERDGAGNVIFPSALLASKDPAVIDAVGRERRLFGLRQTDRKGALSLLTQRVGQLDDQIRSLEAQIVAIDAQAKLIEPELAGLRTLYEKKLVTLGRINELERTAVQLQGSRAALTANIAEARGRISETREQMLNVDKAARSEAASELATVVAQINDQQVRQASANTSFTRSVIRAPQSGTIDKLAFSTIGSAIPPNQPILQIVPDRDVLIVAVRVRPNDIDQVRKGQKARVTFSGFDRQSTPDFYGVVTFVSADLSQDQHTGESFYRIKVRLDTGGAAPASRLALKPGMPAEVFIETGDRSILSYLVKPLLDQIRHAFREG